MLGLSENERLMRAARTGDLEKVKSLLNKGAKASAHWMKWSNHTTPLYETVVNNHLDVADYLFGYTPKLLPVMDKSVRFRVETTMREQRQRS